MADRAHLERLTKQLANDGKLLEAGWVGLRIVWLPKGGTPEQLDMLRKAYMAGAQHLYSSIMTMQDEGSEVTEADFKRMALIDEELRVFGEELLNELPTEGEG